jgi:hypothetical protein
MLHLSDAKQVGAIRRNSASRRRLHCNVANMIGGALGNVITMFGSIAIIYAVVEVFRKKPAA